MSNGSIPVAGGRIRSGMDTGHYRKTRMKLISDISAQDPAIIGSPAFGDPESLYDSIVEISSILMNTERVSLMLPDHGVLRIKGVKGIDKSAAKKIRIRIGAGISGTVYKEGKPLIVTGIERDLPAQKKKNYRTGSFVCMPLKLGDETVGVLNLTDRRDGRSFSQSDMKFLLNLAYFASIAIKGAHCYCRQKELKTLSVTDGLTGLFNRRYFDERLREELHRGVRHNSFFSLTILDIDDFKIFNDTEGHLAGDEVLKAIGHIARKSLRSIDVLARYGGEEFAVIMPGTEKEEAFPVAERTRKKIRELMSGRWENFPHRGITVSIGIASFPSDGRDAGMLIKNADKALYKAKSRGKDRTIVCDRV